MFMWHTEKKGKKQSNKKLKIKNKIPDLNLTKSLLTSNINWLNILIQRHTLVNEF